MFSIKIVIPAALLALLVADVNSDICGGTVGLSPDLSKAELRKLYNSKVYEADRMKRPLNCPNLHISVNAGVLSHSGVRVTLKDGSRWLVHKGSRFGISSQTVVVAARHMSSDWKIIETKNFGGCKTVSDFVKAGGSDYSLIFNNCHMGAGRMWELCD